MGVNLPGQEQAVAVPRVAVIILLSLRATRGWFDGYVETRVAVS